MGMYTIKLEDNLGNTLDVLYDSVFLVDDILVSISQKQRGLLQHIDPYGDTVFNGIQVEAMMPELDAAFLVPKSKEATEILEALKRMAIKCNEDVHQFIKFFGD
jgi:hypothetical protein